MATVTFTRCTDATVMNSDIAVTGRITFNTGNKNIYLGTDGTNYVTFKGTDTDTKNTTGSSNTSSKIYLVGATSQATNPVTYSHDTVYVGTDGYLYSGGQKVMSDWVTLNSTTGVLWSTFASNTTYNKAKELLVNIKRCPAELLFPRAMSHTAGPLVSTSVHLIKNLPGSYWYNSSYTSWSVYGGVVWHQIQSDSDDYYYNMSSYGFTVYQTTGGNNQHVSNYYQYLRGSTSSNSYVPAWYGIFTDYDTYNNSSNDARPYLYVTAVKY